MSSGRQVNWSGVVFTRLPSGTTNIATVQNIQIASRGQELQASGDADIYPTYSRTIRIAPQVTITHQNDTLIQTLPTGQRGSSLVMVHNDANNDSGASSGAVQHTFANVHIVSHDPGGPHQQIGSVTMVVNARSTDGITNPWTISIL